MSAREPIDILAEEFVARYRRGERPALTDYIETHPDLADEIRELFPGLVMMEVAGSDLGKADQIQGRPTTTADQLPHQIGNYRILRKIGQGGMGIVYEAMQMSLDRHIALKVLPHHSLVDGNQVCRFQQEAKATAGLHHSNIVPVFEIGEAQGLLFYAMQFIRGHGLDQVIQELKQFQTSPQNQNSPTTIQGDSHVNEIRALAKSILAGLFRSSTEDACSEPAAVSNDSASVDQELSDTNVDAVMSQTVPFKGTVRSGVDGDSRSWNYFRSVADIGIQVADAISYAHAAGVLHRDIKPSNLLLDLRGTVWVTDFGLAKVADARDLTRTGDVVGTLRYMAPERFQGKADQRSDVYSIGLTLYELLAHRPAFAATDREQLLQQITQHKPAPPRSICRHIPRDLETIVLKSIAAEPEQRYASANALADDLRRFVGNKPIAARRPTPLRRMQLWFRRNPAIATLTVLVFGLLVLLAVSSFAGMYFFRQERDVAQLSEKRATAAADTAKRAERLSNERLYASLVAQARAHRLSGQAGQRWESLKALRKAATLSRQLKLAAKETLRLRNEAIMALAYPDMGLGKSWLGRLRTPVPPDGAAKRRERGFDFGASLRCHADNEGNIVVQRVTDKKLIATMPGQGEAVARTRFSPNDSYLAAFYSGPIDKNKRQTVVRLWNVRTKKVVLTVADVTSRSVAFADDESEVAFSLRSGSIRRFDLPSAREKPAIVPDQPAPEPMLLSYAPDASLLAVQRKSSGVRLLEIVDLETTKTVSQFEHQSTYIQDVAWSGDGSVVATACRDGLIYLWSVRSGKNAMLQGHLTSVKSVAFCRSGNMLVSSSMDGTIRLWEIASRRQLLCFDMRQFDRGRTDAPPFASPAMLRFQADDRKLAYTIEGYKYGYCDVEPAHDCQSFLLPADEEVRDLAISTDGRLLAIGYGARDNRRKDGGIRFRDLLTGTEIGQIPAPLIKQLALTADGSAVLYRQAGLARCGIRKVRTPGSIRLQVGLATLVRLGGVSSDSRTQSYHTVDPTGIPLVSHAFFTTDRRRVCVPNWKQKGHTGFFDLNGRLTEKSLGPRSPYYMAAVSPGGWMAGQCGARLGPIIWDAKTGAVAHELPSDRNAFWLTFSPDARWLLTGHRRKEICFWNTRTWKRSHAIAIQSPGGFPPVFAFSSNSRLLAMSQLDGAVKLIDPTNGQEIATLNPLYPDLIRVLRFSKDGVFLVAGTAGGRIHVWDFRRIRAALHQLKLDWNHPPLPPIPGNQLPLRFERRFERL